MSPALIVHITAGGVGLFSGAGALLVRKGANLHRVFGTVFFVAMLIMSLLGAVIAAFMPERGTVMVGLLTFYLILTSWMTVRRKESGVDLFDYGALAAAIGITAVLVLFGLQGQANPNGLLDSIPAAVHYVFAGLTAFAAGMDIKVIASRGVTGPQRTARHLWRMCTALLIASFSFFFGQQKVLPEIVRGTPWLFLPEVLVLGMLVYSMVRVRMTRRPKRNAVPA